MSVLTQALTQHSVVTAGQASGEAWPLDALSPAAKASIVHLSAPVKLLSGASALVSLRRLMDNTARTFSAQADGTLDTADIISWAAGTTLYKHKQFSQVPGTTDMTQDDITAQPVFDPATEDDTYNGSSHWMDITGCLTSGDILTAYPAVTFVSRAKRTTGSGAVIAHSSDSVMRMINTMIGTGIRATQRAGSTQRTVTDTTVDSNFHTIIIEFNFALTPAPTMTMWVDNNAPLSTALDMVGVLTATKTSVGAVWGPTLGTFLNGALSGTAVFTSALSPADRLLMTSTWSTL